MNKKKIALLSGITGMDGSHLAELLLNKGYEVHGIIRRSSSFNTQRIDHIFDQLILHYGDLTDPLSLSNIISKVQPDELYNLGAMSHVKVSFESAHYTALTDGVGVLNVIEAVKNHSPHTKIYQASTSELYGDVQSTKPQSETTEFLPQSPYAIAKLYGYWISKNYRESYNMFISNGILFNHSGPRRGETFVERKITKGLTDIIKGKKDCIYLGNLNSKRDIGYSPEFCEGMWMMLQQDTPDDFVLATGETHTIREIINISATYLGIDISWQGEDIDEVGIDQNTGNIVIRIDSKYFRPCEVDLLIGDATKAKTILGWEPKTKFKELIELMTEYDLKNNS